MLSWPFCATAKAITFFLFVVARSDQKLYSKNMTNTTKFDNSLVKHLRGCGYSDSEIAEQLSGLLCGDTESETDGDCTDCKTTVYEGEGAYCGDCDALLCERCDNHHDCAA